MDGQGLFQKNLNGIKYLERILEENIAQNTFKINNLQMGLEVLDEVAVPPAAARGARSRV